MHRQDYAYETVANNVLPNGLTLLQVNPDVAASLDRQAGDFGWVYTKAGDDQWVTHSKLTESEIEMARDQAADMAVLVGREEY